MYKIVKRTFNIYQQHVQYISDLVKWGYADNKSAVVRLALLKAWRKEAMKNGIYQQFER